MFTIGQIVTKENYVQAALWCNKNGAHIEKQSGYYVIVENSVQELPSIEDKVITLENKTGLTRAIRELVLSENSGSSEYVKQQANEIELLAKQLRN